MAGNIIPAIATTNAIIAGLIVLEAMKILQGRFKDCKTVSCYIYIHIFFLIHSSIQLTMFYFRISLPPLISTWFWYSSPLFHSLAAHLMKLFPRWSHDNENKTLVDIYCNISNNLVFLLTYSIFIIWLFSQVYLNRRPNPKKRLLVPCVLDKPNPKCYVCSEKPEVSVRLNVEKITVKVLEDRILKSALNMIAPDVELCDGKGTILISSEEGETEANNDKLLKVGYDHILETSSAA